MDIRSQSALKQEALRALNRGRDPRKIVTAYAGATVLIAAVLTLINFLLEQQMAGAGGLSNLGTRSLLSTVETILPIVQMVLLLCLEFGYLHGMMRIARGQYADQTDLKVGFHNFGPILRLTLLQSLLFCAIGILAFYVAMQVFLITPWGAPVIELLMPLIESGTTVIDEATALQAGQLMIPMIVIFIILYGVVVIPLIFRFRMANYALLDNPRAGAVAALRESRKMMRGNCIHLLKLDLSFWWFYLLQALATVLCYGDMILLWLGITLPFSTTVSYYLFYALYLAALFAITYFLRNPVETAYIMAYESIHEKPKDNGIVLGNIFDM